MGTADAKSSLNPTALSLADAAKVLTKIGGIEITEAMLQEDIDDGSPANTDGTLNLVHYGAWLVREVARANSANAR